MRDNLIIKSSYDIIHRAYSAFQFNSGWTFLCCPESRFETAEVAVIGLNPGGRDTAGPYLESWEQPDNPYFTEFWGADGSYSPLQQQIQHWHRLAGLRQDETLCAQFVPFRSRDWQGLTNQAEVLEFSISLWSRLLADCHASTFITMGKVAGNNFSNMLGCGLATYFPCGWGKASIILRKSPQGRRVIIMPHPSRYRLFGRENGLSDAAEASFRLALST